MDIIDITTSSSDEADEYHPKPARLPRKPVKKGKGKARAPTPDSDVLVISSSASGLDDDWPERSEQASTSGSLDVIDVDSGSNEADPLAQVLEIVPDVDPDFVEELIAKNLPTFGDKVVETVLHTLLEDRSYPKSVKKRKADVAAVGGSAPKKTKVGDKVDYASTNRNFTGGVFYNDLAIVRRSHKMTWLNLYILPGSIDCRLYRYSKGIPPQAIGIKERSLCTDAYLHC